MEELETLLSRSDAPEGIAEALKRDGGARQYRCALQVNPFDYGLRHSKETAYKDEAAYNAAMIDACLANDVEVVAITDHFRFDGSVGLTDALREAGIHVFPGFEANSSEGIHLLCLFPESTDASSMNRYIGLCGVRDLTVESPQSEKTAEQICVHVAKVGGLAIAAHATSASGLLTVLNGQSRARTWKNPHLYAAAVAGSRTSVQQCFRSIVNNTDTTTKRDRSLAIINANDVSDPAQMADNSASTLIKMSEVSIEGLRQAFLDHESRIQLNSESLEAPHTEVLSVAWAGGLLDGESVKLNPSLNVLIGGRGSGKSTFIESIRYALGLIPRGIEAQRSHASITKDVIKAGTEISVLIYSPYPSPQHYLIRRIYGDSPKVFDESGELLPELKPADVIGNLEVYGQHEISELTRQSGEIAGILRRFIVSDEEDNLSEIISDLEDNGTAIVAEIEKVERLNGTLSILPELKEKLKRFEAVKLDEKLKSKAIVDEEEGSFASLEEEISAVEERADDLCLEEYDGILLEGWEDRALNPATLRQIDQIQGRLIRASERARNYLLAISQQARTQSRQIKKSWNAAKEQVESDYNKTLRELNKKGEDGSAYVKIRKQIADLSPKEKQHSAALNLLDELRNKRKKLLTIFEQEKAKDRRSLEKAAKRVSKKLKGKVRVEIHDSVDLSSLEDLISEHVNGKFTQAMTRLEEQETLNLSDLAAAVRKGASALQTLYGISKLTAEKFEVAGEELALAIESHKLTPEAVLNLNVGSDKSENWKSIDQLSTGQKATAVLLLLLLESDAPLIIDQPEDDLDNRFIVGSIVSSIRIEKKSRQFILSSHNANIPVLGDAEQIIGLNPVIEEGVEYSEILEEHCGSIDRPAVKNMVKDILEGGQEAFEFRREKYGF